MARYRLIMKQRFGNLTTGLQALNVFHYESVSGTPSGADLLAVFDAIILEAWEELISSAVLLEPLEAQNLDDPVDFALRTPTFATAGVGTGESLPPFVAFSFQYVRASRASRHGWKRFMGVSEPQQAGGTIIPADLTLANLLADVLEDTLIGATASYAPRIARRPPVGGTLDQTVLFPVAEVVYAGITSQNTRKFGRGT